MTQTGIVADPGLNALDDIKPPRWVEENGNFDDGSSTIRQAFLRLAPEIRS